MEGVLYANAHIYILGFNPDCSLEVNLATKKYSPFEKGGGGDLNFAWIQKSPSIPLLQRGKFAEFFNGLFGFKSCVVGS